MDSNVSLIWPRPHPVPGRLPLLTFWHDCDVCGYFRNKNIPSEVNKINLQQLKSVYPQLKNYDEQFIQEYVLKDRVFIKHSENGTSFFHSCSDGHFIHRIERKLEGRNYDCVFREQFFREFDNLGESFFNYLLDHLMTACGIVFVDYSPVGMPIREGFLKKRREATFYNEDGTLRSDILKNELSPEKMAEAGFECTKPFEVDAGSLVYCRYGDHYLRGFQPYETPLGAHLKGKRDCPWVHLYFSSPRWLGNDQGHYKAYSTLLALDSFGDVILNKSVVKELNKEEILEIAKFSVFFLHQKSLEDVKTFQLTSPVFDFVDDCNRAYMAYSNQIERLVEFFSSYLEDDAVNDLWELMRIKGGEVAKIIDKLRQENERHLKSVSDIFSISD